MRPAVWARGDPSAAEREVVRFEFQLSRYELDEKANTLPVYGYETYSWSDPRLNYTVAAGCDRGGDGPPPEWLLSPGFVAKIWHPDVYVANAMDERRAFRDTDTVYIAPSGTVIFSYQSRRTVACQLRLRSFPMDVQRCRIAIGSRGRPRRRAPFFFWSARGAPGTRTSRERSRSAPSRSGRASTARRSRTTSGRSSTSGSTPSTRRTRASCHAPRRPLSRAASRDAPIPPSGRYSEAHLGLKFRRKHQYYVAEALFPALFFLAIAWSGFWVERESAPARVSIAVIPVLIMRTLLNGVYANLQIISYSIFLTSLLHLGESLAVISVFEYALVSWVLGHERERLGEHRLYIALRVPILHYVQMSDAPAPADDAPGPRAAVVAAVDRLRDGFARRPRPSAFFLPRTLAPPPRSGTRATTAASTDRAWQIQHRREP